MKYKEVAIAKKSGLKDGEMKAFSADGTEILLSRINGEFFALAAHCTHYGAPLETGLLNGERIVCPWHHACFNAKTGNLLEPPARDALERYEVKIEGDDIIVRLPEEPAGSRMPEMVRRDKNDRRTFVILGAGASGNAAAQALREAGFAGRIVMVTYENRIPYDRPNVSKDYLQGTAEPEWMPLRPEDFYEEHDIELMRETEVIEADIAEKTVKLSSGERLKYDSILLALGGTSRTLNIPGADLKNVFTLRSFDDADRIIAAAKKASKIAIVGASFIGMETAFSLRGREKDVTMIGLEAVPFERVFGEEIGRMFQKLHEENGVKFKLNTAVERFDGDESVQAVALKNGDRVEADLVIVGVGVKPATDVLRGIDLEPDGSVKVDRYFHAGNNVFAAGDIATFPDWHTGQGIRIEHWRTAEQQGRIAAFNMAGKKTAYESVPFFWTVQAGLHLRYVGHAADWDEIILHGDVSQQNFIVFYVKNNQVHAAAACQRDKELCAVEELMRLKKMPPPAKLRDKSVDLFQMLMG